jgi:hypothetical protein
MRCLPLSISRMPDSPWVSRRPFSFFKFYFIHPRVTFIQIDKHRINGVKKGRSDRAFETTFAVLPNQERHEDAFSTSWVSHPTNPSPVDFVSSTSVCVMASALDVFANRSLDPSRLTGLRFRVDLDVTSHRVADLEINISGNQVFVALASSLCLAGPLVWAFVRYWIFAP